jgi:hypothetical protein
MRSVKLLQDVPLHEKWHSKGVVFRVVEVADPRASPPQVDVRTAAAWLQNGWAVEDVTAPKKAPPDAG